MPFHRPAPEGSLGGVHYCWRLHSAGGAPLSGDALVVETGRPDGRALFLLLDAAGKGAPAAEVVRVLCDRLLRERACAGLAPAELLRRLHGMLQPVWALTGRFVAALAVLVAGPDGVLRAAGAGLPPPWARAANAGWAAWEPAGGVPLGIPVEDPYGQSDLAVGPGALVLAFSDGLSEAQDAAGRQYAHGPMATLLGALPEGVAGPTLLEALLADVRGHVGALWPQDDTTLLCLWRPPDPERPAGAPSGSGGPGRMP
jgi:serine phosphatase RsbU (regulator of sigma subunit)